MSKSVFNYWMSSHELDKERESKIGRERENEREPV